MPNAPRALLALRPAAAMHRLPARSEACPLSLKDVLALLPGSALAPGGALLPLVAAPLPGVARAALLAAKEAGAVVGLALVAGLAPGPWFEAVARAADELAPGLPFFLSGEVRVGAGEGDLDRALASAHALVEAGVGHLAVDVSALPLALRAEAASRVAGVAAEREAAVECVLPPGVLDPEEAAGFLEEFEGWGVRADLVGARQPAASDAAEAGAQAAALAALSLGLGGRPVARRGPVSPPLAPALRQHVAVRLCEDGGAALAAGVRAVPAELRAGMAGRRDGALPEPVAERLEAFAHGQVATLLEGAGSAGSVERLLRALGARR
jgi:hypothetical protein